MLFFKNNSKGFTIIETLVAIFILVIGIVGVMSIFPLGARIGKFSEMNTVATQLAQAKIEEIIASSYAEIPVGTIETKHQLDAPFSAYSRETEVRYYDPPNQTTTDTDLGIKKIKVTVTWALYLGTSQQEVEVNALIAQR